MVIKDRGRVRLFNPDGNIRKLGEIEDDVITFAVLHYGGNLSEISRNLGVGRSTLYRKLERYHDLARREIAVNSNPSPSERQKDAATHVAFCCR